jgi:hypothetical protein
MVQRIDHLFETGALATKLLRLVGRIPDGGVFELAPDLVEPLFLVIVFKGTS